MVFTAVVLFLLYKLCELLLNIISIILTYLVIYGIMILGYIEQ